LFSFESISLDVTSLSALCLCSYEGLCLSSCANCTRCSRRVTSWPA